MTTITNLFNSAFYSFHLGSSSKITFEYNKSVGMRKEKKIKKEEGNNKREIEAK